MNVRLVLTLTATALCLWGCATELLYLTPGGQTWQRHDPPTPAATPEERLAVEGAIQGKKEIRRDSARAVLETQDQGTSFVVVETETPNSPDVVKRVRFQVRGEMIEAESAPVIVNRRREGYAREAAVEALNGESPDLPRLINGKYLYKAVKEDDCNFRVTETDNHRTPLETYQFNLCNQ